MSTVDFVVLPFRTSRAYVEYSGNRAQPRYIASRTGLATRKYLAAM